MAKQKKNNVVNDLVGKESLEQFSGNGHKANGQKEKQGEEPQVNGEQPGDNSSQKSKSAAKKVGGKKKAVIKSTGKKDTHTTLFTLRLRFYTKFGQSLYVTGNHPMLGSNDIDKALPMRFFNEDAWTVTIPLESHSLKEPVVYNYVLKDTDGSVSIDWGNDKILDDNLAHYKEVTIEDSWNHAGYYENVFFTEPFKNVLLRNTVTDISVKKPKTITHLFKVKAPLLKKGEVPCLLGSDEVLSNWNIESPYLLSKSDDADYWTVELDLSKASFPLSYKYGVYNVEEKTFVRFETQNNRFLYEAAGKKKLVCVNDGFVVLPNNTWKGAGVAIPVFSLRSEKSLGVGEFTDIKLLVDWAKRTGLKLVQILPVNDTTATHTWMDSYPYAGISAFALHPLYLNVFALANKKDIDLINELEEARAKLNAEPSLPYDGVMQVKLKAVSAIYQKQKIKTFTSLSYKTFFKDNKHWLEPYALFCYLRDWFKTADFSQWGQYADYNNPAVKQLLTEEVAIDELGLHYFIQYQLHVQLKDATNYAHENGIIVKGDIPIGIYRNGCDAWEHPELYHMDVQAGAPPDDFAVTGQNWGFPTYNWQKMKEDGFNWWKKRFQQMSCYFDAFRIDHILGFFRIWSIPMDAVEGIMGHFEPALPVHINEFDFRNIYFDYTRYCRPFINDEILWQLFNDDHEYIKENFLVYDGFGQYQVKPEFATQRQVEKHFAEQETTDRNKKLQDGLFTLLSNVILFEVPGSQAQQFHFRFGIEDTSSFRALDPHTQFHLKELYVNYFFERQDNFWAQEAMSKLPALKRVTNMLICGEDLGLVPDCVPDVMKELGILSLEIQRMPKDSKRQFFHPNDAPYLSVVTPSTHDMSTIRGWWEEDRERTQKFFNKDLGKWGNAPYYCEPEVAKNIIHKNLYEPSRWAIFQMKDL
ncbi:MAG: 4-alpha-glucanotransferase, partial [Chitinophagaceae bacterium]|nr:4-alpha-glucanotransferase [Chitinophagaceae bacterium]